MMTEAAAQAAYERMRALRRVFTARDVFIAEIAHQAELDKAWRQGGEFPGCCPLEDGEKGANNDLG